MKVSLHIRRQVAGELLNNGGMGNMLREACCWGEHTFPQSHPCHDGVTAGTLSAVAAAGKPWVEKYKEKLGDRGDRANAGISLSQWQASCTFVYGVWVEMANVVVKEVRNIASVIQSTCTALFQSIRVEAYCSVLPVLWRSALQRFVRRKRLKSIKKFNYLCNAFISFIWETVEQKKIKVRTTPLTKVEAGRERKIILYLFQITWNKLSLFVCLTCICCYLQLLTSLSFPRYTDRLMCVIWCKVLFGAVVCSTSIWSQKSI